MSTLDTLINAVSAVGVNDIWKTVVPGKDDKYYLHAARLAAVGATLLGVVLVPIFELDDQIYTAHSKFFTTILPSLIVVLLMGVLWAPFHADSSVLGTSLGVPAYPCYPPQIPLFPN